MKKIFSFGLAFLLLAPALFADDAKVMPALVGRFYIAPNFTIAPGAFDEDGKLENFDDGSVNVFNLGFALEFGVIDWITAALQWVPGVTVWSDIKPALGGVVKGDVNTNGVGDLFLGAKLQIVGATAPVKSNNVRFAAAPGVKIPLPGPDFEEEYKKFVKNQGGQSNDAVTFSSMDNHVFAAGGRFYFDYTLNDNFFINLYNETIFYPVKQDLNKYGPYFAGLKSGLSALEPVMSGAEAFAPGITKAFNDISGEVNYKNKITFELEPVFSTNLADGVVFTAGLPINYSYKPAYDFTLDINNVKNKTKTAKAAVDATLNSMTPDPNNPAYMGLATLQGGLELAEGMLDEKTLLEMAGLEGKASHALSINPGVSVFMMKLPLPLEFKLQYNIPVWGQETQARHTMAFQIRAYFAFR